MGEIDQFITNQVTPMLLPGETLLGTGFVRQPTKINLLGVVGEYTDSWNVAATNQRLILMLTDTSGMLAAKPRPMSKRIVTWWFQELREVTIGRCVNSDGVHFALIPHEPLGPYEGGAKRYDTFPVTEGVDGQAQFFGQFPTWLQQQVAQRAFPMDAERQARVQAKQGANAAEQQRSAEAAQRRQEAVGAAAQAAATWIGPVVLGLAALGLLIAGIVFAVDGREEKAKSSRQAQREAKMLAIANANLELGKSGKEPGTDCPEEALQRMELSNRCHGCYVSEVAQTGAARTYQRGDKIWSCPSVAELEATVEKWRSVVDGYASAGHRGGGRMRTGMAMSGAGVVVGIGAVVLRRKRRRP